MKQTQEPVFEPMPETPAEPESPTPEPAGQPAASLAEAKKNILVGLLWCIGGLAFSFISYYLTEAGGRYVIATGAILWGAWQAITGLYIWLKIKYSAGEYAAFWRMLVAAVCTALLIGYLSVLSTQLVNEGGELPLLDNEQTYDCPDLGLRIRIPAGYTAVEEEAEPETDSTYARYDVRPRRRMGVQHRRPAKRDRRGRGERRRPLGLLPEPRLGLLRRRNHQGFAPLHGERHRHAAQRRPPDGISGSVFTNYDLKQGQSLITVGISYPANEYGKTSTLRAHRGAAPGIELTEPTE